MKSLMCSLVLFLAACGACSAQEVLKQEPTQPTWADPGSKYLVDDGSCGRGKIKEVTVGNWTKDMTFEQAKALRKRRCIARR
jgi:hypothetical protein